MQKYEQSSCQMVMCHLAAILGVDIEKATKIIDELEQLGLIRFDEFGNVGILVLDTVKPSKLSHYLQAIQETITFLNSFKRANIGC